MGKPARTELGFLTGLIAGEGCFFIGPRNAGASAACVFRLALRADDTPVLVAARDLLDAGSLRNVKARGRSRPQTAWVVQRKADCSRLSSILDRAPLIAKKAGEFRIWHRAVEVWCRDRGVAWSTLAPLSADLSAYRQPTNGPDHTRVDISQDYLDGFLAGFATAEGHFGATEDGTAIFVLRLREDDSAVLRFLRSRLDVGWLDDQVGRARGHPCVVWYVTTIEDTAQLMVALDRCPPRGRKGRIYEAWRELVRFRRLARGDRSASARAGRRDLARRVTLAGAYEGPVSFDIRDPEEARRERCRVALRAWASSSPPPYTATAYKRARHARGDGAWPNRDTIARIFGSWRDALEQCDLPTDGTPDPGVTERVRSSARVGREAHDQRQRALILRGVRRCAAELGRWPSATEFFRWRNERAPDLPSHGTVYRLFPEGFEQVVATARDQTSSASRAAHSPTRSAM